MPTVDLYEYDSVCAADYIDVPAWIDADITAADVAAIEHGGCDSGAYMPAVTYSTAADTMHKHGDAVLDYLEAVHGDVPAPPRGASWSAIAVHYLSMAVDAWAAGAAEELRTALGPADDDE
jgi:hypothetical protein